MKVDFLSPSESCNGKFATASWSLLLLPFNLDVWWTGRALRNPHGQHQSEKSFPSSYHARTGKRARWRVPRREYTSGVDH